LIFVSPANESLRPSCRRTYAPRRGSAVNSPLFGSDTAAFNVQ
jgi:hypothetical protein